MGSVSTATFRKRKTCTSTELLLLYHDAVLAPSLRRGVEAHLAECDFCGAELYLLAKHPPTGLPAYAPAALPEHLRRLALELLRAAPRVASRTLELIYDHPRLTLTDA
ncbi:MAG TPA: hypothetical protein VF546_03235 [Pyrinomonadaceae bacterium]|jgi:hypothetical protein